MRSFLTSAALAALILNADAFPSMSRAILEEATKRLAESGLDPRQLPGITPPFDAASQYVSNTGEHAFVAPVEGDQRGPCPGLNAMANHGYLPHNGIATIAEFTQGCFDVFGMGLDLGGFLGVYGAVFDGDLTAWSIGGPSAALPVVSNLLGTPQGISGSHNKYENDASPIRGDLYTYGNSYLNQVPLFEQFYATQEGVPDNKVNYDLNIITDFRAARFANSIDNNPYFWNGPFSGIIASPAAYSFIYRFMANKSAEYPSGRLDRKTLKSFYSITGKPGNFKYTAGHERIPDNWYKRNDVDAYSIPYFAVDALAQYIKYPNLASLGGNLGKNNSFVGIDPLNITGGVYNAQMLAQGNNLVCFGFELGLDSAPDLLEGLFLDITPAMSILRPAFKKAEKGLGCPQIERKKYNQFKKYPGFSQSYNGYTGQK